MASSHRLSISLHGQKNLRPAPLSLSNPRPEWNPLTVLIDNIYFLPLSWRKFILDACRLQVSPLTNDHLVASALSLEPQTFSIEFWTKTVDSIDLSAFEDQGFQFDPYLNYEEKVSSIPGNHALTYTANIGEITTLLDLLTHSHIGCSLTTMILSDISTAILRRRVAARSTEHGLSVFSI